MAQGRPPKRRGPPPWWSCWGKRICTSRTLTCPTRGVCPGLPYRADLSHPLRRWDPHKNDVFLVRRPPLHLTVTSGLTFQILLIWSDFELFPFICATVSSRYFLGTEIFKSPARTVPFLPFCILVNLDLSFLLKFHLHPFSSENPLWA